MRVSFLFFITTLLVLSCTPQASAQASASNTFTTNLSLGARGTQVTLLQQTLNRDLDTRIANTGPGSPGYETDYFGLLTKAAVVRFQEKYANEVLAPAGLTQGSGYVGLYTRAKLNALSSLATNTPPLLSPSTSSASTTTTGSGQTTAPQNPNLKNLDKFFATIDRVQGKQGLSAIAITNIKEHVMKELATTTDLRATFLKQIQNKSRQSVNNSSGAGGLLATIKHALESFFITEHARAAVGVPFGGALIEPFFCEDSGNWWLTIEPLPPTYVTELSYEPFSQAFLSYNIPFTEWLLGEYEPVGVCVFACPDCIVVETEGTITLKVGSSPL